MVLQRLFDIPHMKAELKTFLSRCRFNGTLVMGDGCFSVQAAMPCVVHLIQLQEHRDRACLSSPSIQPPLWDTLELCLSWKVPAA